jgi:hypothetical protein
MSPEEKIEKAIELAVRCGGIDGLHHARWVIDQMVRALTGCPLVTKTAKDCNGRPYSYETVGESDEYRRLVAEAKAGDDGPESYEWDCGVPA